MSMPISVTSTDSEELANLKGLSGFKRFTNAIISEGREGKSPEGA